MYLYYDSYKEDARRYEKTRGSVGLLIDNNREDKIIKINKKIIRKYIRDVRVNMLLIYRIPGAKRYFHVRRDLRVFFAIL